MDSRTGELIRAEQFKDLQDEVKERLVPVPDKEEEKAAYEAMMQWGKALRLAEKQVKVKRQRRRARKLARASKRRNR